MSEPAAQIQEYEQELEVKLRDWRWRMNNLYWITDKDTGKEILFKMNDAQEELFSNLWHRNVILKARQLGFTTFMLIFMLDAALFRKNIRCGMIAHTKDDAKRLFREKLRFAYDRLPESVRSSNPASNDSAGELVFKSGSSVSISTSFRGGTLNYLHISEFGKICRMWPAKAEEIVTGAFEAVSKDGVICVESTAEGREGHFFDICQLAEQQNDAGVNLTRLDFKFFFFPWYKDPEYSISGAEAEDVIIPRRLIDYFIELRTKYRITLSKGQMIWYTLKERSLGEKMKQEYPSFPAEAFWQTVKGAYYHEQFSLIYKRKQICRVPHDEGALVHTFWDLGLNDANAIWFIQAAGLEWRIINYYENSDVGVQHYANYINRLRLEEGYMFGLHVAPHDIKVREWGNDAKTRLESAKEAGISFIQMPQMSRNDGIECVRRVLPRCWFDEERTEKGVSNLQLYRKIWDDNRGTWKDAPFHGPESNGADAFRTFAVSIPLINEFIAEQGATASLQQAPPAGGWYS